MRPGVALGLALLMGPLALVPPILAEDEEPVRSDEEIEALRAEIAASRERVVAHEQQERERESQAELHAKAVVGVGGSDPGDL